VLAPVAEQERTQHEPADRDQDQDARLHVESVQGQRATPQQDSHDDEPGMRGCIRPKDFEDRCAGARQEIVAALAFDALHAISVPCRGKTTTLRPRCVGANRAPNVMICLGPSGPLRVKSGSEARRRALRRLAKAGWVAATNAVKGPTMPLIDRVSPMGAARRRVEY